MLQNSYLNRVDSAGKQQGMNFECNPPSKTNRVMKRDNLIKRLSNQASQFDMVVIGGGATGLGIALDAATRGYSVVLFEQSDFTKSTSSRSTKLVHGGVRYLAQGDVRLVTEALRERGLLLRNAPHLCHNQPFIIPAYHTWEIPFYTSGLTMYDILAGKLSLGRSRYLSRNGVILHLPTLKQRGLKGGTLYYDGQFDDSRLGVNLMQSILEHNGIALNYMRVESFIKNGKGRIRGVVVRDCINDVEHEVRAVNVVNATGVFVDEIMSMDSPEHQAMVRPSQGVHLTLPKEFLPGDAALMIPRTDDGRVLFAVPWYDKVIVGTTDTVVPNSTLEPTALESEIEFILTTAGRYLQQAPQHSDVLSTFAGLRPLAAPKEGDKSTKEISRNHKIIVSPSGLITIVGGKWTTYRQMAQDVVDRAEVVAGISHRPCTTTNLKIHGYSESVDPTDPLGFYGFDVLAIREMTITEPTLSELLDKEYPYIAAQVVWAVEQEMAQHIEDFLARRIRILFLDARASLRMAPKVAQIMARLLKKDKQWIDSEVASYEKLASNYIIN